MNERTVSRRPPRARASDIRLEGIIISPGIGIARARILERDISVLRDHIDAARVKTEQRLYDAAVREVRQNLHDHVEKVHPERELLPALILKAHEAMVKDRQFHAAVRSRISSELVNAAWALETEGQRIADKLEASRNPYLQARAADVWDLVGSILEALDPERGTRKERAPGEEGTRIMVSAHLYPSMVVRAKLARAPAFITESRALSSHGAVLLKGFAIPAVGGVTGLTENIADGDPVIVDATNGVVVVRPSPATRRKYEASRRDLKTPGSIPLLPPLGGRTRDGVEIRLLANVDNPQQMDDVRRYRLQGVGLFRSEFFALTQESPPSEDEQCDVYRRVFEAAGDSPVAIRTFDIAADKTMVTMHECTGRNPSLGVRGVRRHLLRCPEELRSQLRAILRAAARRPVGVLIPMVTSVEEVREIKKQLAMIEQELGAGGDSFGSRVRLGAMIEVPAAAIAIQDILSETDFVNVGTNDLLQYLVAADRDNEAVLDYLDPESKAFKWLLRFIMEKAGELGRGEDVTVCGEIASDPKMIPLLLGLGYRSLSISPTSTRLVREAIAAIDLRSLRKKPRSKPSVERPDAREP